jgi:hypothetical protein
MSFANAANPTAGGETPILLSNVLYRRAHEALPQFIDKLEHVGVKYQRNMLEQDDPASAIGRGTHTAVFHLAVSCHFESIFFLRSFFPY